MEFVPFGLARLVPVSTAIRLRLGPPASGKTQLLRRLAMEAIMAHEGEASSSETSVMKLDAHYGVFGGISSFLGVITQKLGV